MDDLRRFDFNLLKALDALLRARSVTGAANALGIGQPAMSHALAQLRHALNDKLLARRGAGMTLTPRAIALIEPVTDILVRIQAGVLQPPAFSPGETQRVFRFGLSDHLQTRFLPALMMRLRQDAPGLRLVVRPTDRETVGAALESGALDLVIAGFPALPTERSRVLRRESLVALFDPQACGCAAPLSIDDYVRLPHFLMSQHGDLTGAVDTALGAIGEAREVILAIPNFLVLPYILPGLAAIAAVPESVARHCHAVAELAVSPLPVHIAAYDVTMIWHASQEPDPGHRWLRELISALPAED